MKNKISVYQEHGNALCIKDGALTITFFPEQVSFTEREERFTLKIRPSLAEANIDKDDYLMLKKYSAEPNNNWLYRRATRCLILSTLAMSPMKKKLNGKL
ncbi:MAG TPA: hypothetical protein VN030_06445 [Cellvibrio sp.]|nr:hypothetical protein [Cellvibrio sp.]